ncbi:hypothetical protein EAG_09242 [Camponotus floridanus]|uniref:Uncharacterized protein n=1 Tax=Camponotus floridanus TaxID=104421 RepID=E2AKM7_CAMFO|nr:hypothetical protein EAG_09242 [Camponotus floridanus]
MASPRQPGTTADTTTILQERISEGRTSPGPNKGPGQRSSLALFRAGRENASRGARGARTSRVSAANWPGVRASPCAASDPAIDPGSRDPGITFAAAARLTSQEEKYTVFGRVGLGQTVKDETEDHPRSREKPSSVRLPTETQTGGLTVEQGTQPDSDWETNIITTATQTELTESCTDENNNGPWGPVKITRTAPRITYR